MEVKIISKESIKPSSPTTLHLQTHKLSLMDQLVPHIYIPMMFFYQITNQEEENISQRTLQLKQSLSETLTRFYPFAGTVKDKETIECNDMGALYVVAKINSPLSEYLKQPDLTLLNKFVPGEDRKSKPTAGAYVTLIQENTFACGSIVIGVFVSHMVADATAMSSFLKYWAATARNSIQLETLSPCFDAPKIFPQAHANFPREARSTSNSMPFLKTMKVATRRFRFDASAIARLKEKASSESVENPTRVEAVTALLCNILMKKVFSKGTETAQKQALVTHAINIRRKAVPPFSESMMGNFIWTVTALLTNGKESNLAGPVSCLRETIAKIDGDFVKNLQGEGGYRKHCEAMKKKKMYDGVEDIISLTSWCNLGHYEIDFGWGKPTWVSCASQEESASIVFINTIMLLDSGWEKGIEAWVYLDREDMLMFEHDQELLSFASLNPSPLKLS